MLVIATKTWTTAKFQNDISKMAVSISNSMLTSMWVRVWFRSGNGCINAVTIQMYVSNSMQISNNCFKLMQSLHVKCIVYGHTYMYVAAI